MVDGIIGGITGGATIAITIKAIDSFSGIFNRASTGIGALGKAFTLGAVAIAATGAALVKVGVEAVQTAASFETAFAGVRKTSNLTEAEFEDLENRFKQLTTTLPSTFEELSGIGEIAGQLGVEGVDNLEKFTKTIADISVTTNLTSEAAATDFARIANIMQIPLDQVDRMGSAVVDLGNNFATTEAEISNFAQRIAGAGQIAGLTTSDVFAIGAAMSSVGVQAEAGGTAVQKVLIEMNTAVTTGSENMETFARTAGMSSEEFKNAWEADAGQAFAMFVQGLGTQGDQAIVTLDNLGLSDQRLVRSFLSLANAGDLVTKTLETSTTAWEKNTALVEEADKRYKTFDSQLKILKNSVRLLFEDIGKELLPVLIDLFEVIKEDILPALKPLIPIIGEFLTEAIRGLSNILPGLIERLGEFIEFSIKLFSALEPLMEPLWEIAFVLFDALYTILEPILPILGTLSELLGTVLKGAIEQVAPFLQVLAEVLGTIFKLLQPIIDLIGTFTGGLSKLTSSLSGLGGSIEKGLTDPLKSAREEIDKMTKSTEEVAKSSEKTSSVVKKSSSSSNKAVDDIIYLNPTPAQKAAQNDDIIYLNDFILTSDGKIIKPSPDDTLIGTKGGIGNTFVFHIDKIQGTDPDDMMEAFQRELSTKISLG